MEDAASEKPKTRRGNGWPGPMTAADGWRSPPRGWMGGAAKKPVTVADGVDWTRWTANEDDTAANVKDGNDSAARRG